MNKARIENTDEIIFADEIFQLYPNYKELVFVCVDKKCSTRMTPSCIKKNSKRRPHFKKYRNQEHIKECEYAILNGLYQKGKDGKLTNTQVNKIGYPSVFKITENIGSDNNINHLDKNDDNDEGVTGRGEIAKLYEFDSENIKFNRKNRVQSIDRIVDWYLGFPYNRDVEIEIEGNKIKYQYFFKRIKGNTKSSELNNERIFYGKIMLSDKNRNVFNKYDNSVYLTLLGFQEKNDVSGKYENYSIKIDKKNITQTLLSRIRNKYDSLFDKAYEDYKNGNIPQNFSLYAFVYGKIDDNNDTILNVEKHHITFRYDEVRKTMQEN
ncbi:hypothetical protein KUL118_65490 [Tenacibaculum sp. KUL118]|nr:hypothetical protein KUL113_55880 [Tenacibaculum sp. KUL113]GFD83687.1 hypothetical protein KUL118_65490 [Tenacibaculum sp. KUL118]